MKKFAALLLAGLLVLSTVGCSKKEDSPAGGASRPDDSFLQTSPAGITDVSDEGISSVSNNQANPIIDAKVGESITFGEYEWVVLDVQDGNALITTKDIISIHQYQTDEVMIATWETSSVRKWLNEDFYDSFNSIEKQYIQKTNVINNDNPRYGTDGGADTVDYLFLLSFDELIKYFGDGGELLARKSDVGLYDDGFDDKRVALLNVPQSHIDELARYLMGLSISIAYKDYDRALQFIEENSGEPYILETRTPGDDPVKVVSMDTEGTLRLDGAINHALWGVRPACWVKESVPSEEPSLSDGHAADRPEEIDTPVNPASHNAEDYFLSDGAFDMIAYLKSFGLTEWQVEKTLVFSYGIQLPGNDIERKSVRFVGVPHDLMGKYADGTTFRYEITSSVGYHLFGEPWGEEKISVKFNHGNGMDGSAPIEKETLYAWLTIVEKFLTTDEDPFAGIGVDAGWYYFEDGKASEYRHD